MIAGIFIAGREAASLPEKSGDGVLGALSRYLALTASAFFAAPLAAQAQHTLASPLFAGLPPPNIQADGALQLERDRPAGWSLAEHRRLDKLLASIQPQRKGVVDAYVVSIALDSDPVFAREAREAGRVLARRYDAVGRTAVLAGPTGVGQSDLPRGSPDNIAAVLARIAELMDPKEDVLVIYSSSHGAPFGIVYNDGDFGYGALSPSWLWTTLGELHINNRLLIVSACFSGVFVPMLSNDTTAIVTAASSDRTSFGCVSENDWTFFGDAMINHALRKPQSLSAAYTEAAGLVGGWEWQGGMIPSNPQINIGARVQSWLGPLEKRMPPAPTAPVGRPAVAALDEAKRNNH